MKKEESLYAVKNFATTIAYFKELHKFAAKVDKAELLHLTTKSLEYTECVSITVAFKNQTRITNIFKCNIFRDFSWPVLFITEIQVGPHRFHRWEVRLYTKI